MNVFRDRAITSPYLVARQVPAGTPTDYENLLADRIEAAFASGVRELAELVARLNADSVRTPDGADWTEANYAAVMQRLGA